MNHLPSLSIELLTAEQGHAAFSELDMLLRDTVDGGASVGFLPPLDEEESQVYWSGVLDRVAQQTRVLMVARSEGRIVGAVQLDLASQPNASHRAEVQKLFVLRGQRKQGIGMRLMLAIEDVARGLERPLLVLDTRQGDVAERLYRRLGYVEVGAIPSYARSATGSLDATVIFYKLLT